MRSVLSACAPVARTRTDRLCAMAADKRAARLGVLAARRHAAVRRHGHAAVVPADGAGRLAAAGRRRPQDQDRPAAARARPHLRRRRPHPRRQPARCSRVAVDWDVIRRDDRPGRAVHPPVGLARRAGRRDGGALRRQPATAATSRCRSPRTSPRTSPSRSRSASRTSPASRSSDGWKRVYPYAPLASHVIGYMGAITAEDEAPLQGPRLRHVARRRGRRARRRRAVLRGRAARQVGRGHLRGRRGQPHRARDQPRTSRSTAWTSSCRSTSTCSSTPSACCRPSCGAMRPPVRPEPRGHQARRHHAGPLDPSLAVGTCVNYKAPAGSTTVMNYQTGADHGDGELPDVRQPLVLRRRRRRQVRRDLPDDRRPTAASSIPTRAPLANRAIQGQYNLGLDVQGVHRLRRPGDRPAQPPARPTTTRARTRCSRRLDRDRRCASGASAACSATRRARARRTRAGTATINVMQSLAVSSDAFFYKLGEEFYLTPGTQLQDHVQPVRLRRRHRHRPAVRVRRPGADERAQGAS